MTKALRMQNTEQTVHFGELIGGNLKGGECIELTSDVGGGKTTFVRGLAKGAGSHDHVSSPTFTISKVYKTPHFEIVHFDFYRLQETGLIEHEIDEAVNDDTTVIVVEWSDIIQHVLPDNRLRIEIVASGDNSREVELIYPDSLAYLVEDVA
jgi:tRNA threonylcarbamoyladenosine biosynthesis protein TsaE